MGSMIDVNIKGLLYGVAAVLPIMQKQKQAHHQHRFGRGLQSLSRRGGTVYSATNSPVRALTGGLAHGAQGRQHSLHTVISPAAVATDTRRSLGRKTQKEFARVPTKSLFRRRHCSRDSLRHEQPADVEIGAGRHPAHCSDLLATETNYAAFKLRVTLSRSLEPSGMKLAEECDESLFISFVVGLGVGFCTV